MRPDPEVVVADSAEALAADVAARTIASLDAGLRARSVAHLVVTGGSILEAVLAALAPQAGGAALDWSRVHVWWGDERYVDADSDDRNDLPAMAKLFDEVPAVLHRMPAADAGYPDVEAAARAYADELAAATPDDRPAAEVPVFDVVLLGLGPDGHCASLFPHHPGLELDGAVIAVHDSPKPPPTRLSLTFETLDEAAEIWFVAAGSGKAEAVARALGGASYQDVPSARPRGRNRTLWLVDRDAAGQLPG